MNGLHIEAARAAGMIRNSSNHILGAVVRWKRPHSLRAGFDSPEQGAASRANFVGSGFFHAREAVRTTPSMVGRVGRAQALPVLVRSVNPARPTTPFDGGVAGSDLSQGATMADPRNTGANAAAVPSLVHIDGASNTTISVGVNPRFAPLTLSEASADMDAEAESEDAREARRAAAARWARDVAAAAARGDE